MTARTYGQFCGLARALEIIGERWSLLVIRDLVLGPKRFDELQQGLPKIPMSILSTRLNELERHGVVQRRVLSQLDAGVVYELTEYGNDLDQIVLQLGLWGARSLGDPTADDLFTLDSAVLSLYTTFQPDAARGVHCAFEMHYGGEMVVHAVVEDGALTAARAAPGPGPRHRAARPGHAEAPERRDGRRERAHQRRSGGQGRSGEAGAVHPDVPHPLGAGEVRRARHALRTFPAAGPGTPVPPFPIRTARCRRRPAARSPVPPTRNR